MIAAAACLRQLTRRRLPGETFVALWWVAALRLLIPLELPARCSVYTLLARLTGPASAPEPGAPVVPAAPAAPPVMVLPSGGGSPAVSVPSGVPANPPFPVKTAVYLTVAAVLALAYWCTRLIGRHGLPGWAKGASPGEGRLELLWQVSLGKSERLVLVRLGERCLLLGVSGGGISVLAELTGEEARPWLQKRETAGAAPSFMEALRENFPKKK